MREIEETFLLKKISLEKTQNNIPYASLLLEDKTGSLCGIIWDENIREEYFDLENKIVTLCGELCTNTKNNKYELVCWKMEPTSSYQYDDYVKGLDENQSKRYTQSLRKQIHLVKHKAYRELLEVFFQKNLHNYTELPANLSSFGVYNGGLLVQTVSVTSMAIQLMRSHKLYAYQPNHEFHFNEDLLITAALLMGAGMCHLYTPFPEAVVVGEYSLISKDLLSIQTVEECMTEISNYISAEEKYLLFHTIQAAYQRDKHATMTREAILLQTAFQTYTKLDEFESIMEENLDKTGIIYIPDKRQRIYMRKNEVEGGADNATKTFYKPENVE